MKKTLTLILAAALLLTSMLTSCTSSEDNNNAGSGSTETTAAPDTTATPEETTPAEPNFEGTLSEILAEITTKSGNDEINGEEHALTSDISEYTVGLTADQMAEYVEEGVIFLPMVNVTAHLVALIKAKDTESATTIKGLLAEQFDNRRWVCVMPEQSGVIEAGQYVLLAVSTKDYSTNLLNAFAELAGEAAGEANIFFEGEEEFIPEDEVLG